MIAIGLANDDMTLFFYYLKISILKAVIYPNGKPKIGLTDIDLILVS